jgi:hypothetical protein
MLLVILFSFSFFCQPSFVVPLLSLRRRAKRIPHNHFTRNHNSFSTLTIVDETAFFLLLLVLLFHLISLFLLHQFIHVNIITAVVVHIFTFPLFRACFPFLLGPFILFIFSILFSPLFISPFLLITLFILRRPFIANSTPCAWSRARRRRKPPQQPRLLAAVRLLRQLHSLCPFCLPPGLHRLCRLLGPLALARQPPLLLGAQLLGALLELGAPPDHAHLALRQARAGTVRAAVRGLGLAQRLRRAHALCCGWYVDAAITAGVAARAVDIDGGEHGECRHFVFSPLPFSRSLFLLPCPMCRWR